MMKAKEIKNLSVEELNKKLNELKNLLEGADYATFWSTLDSDDLYADLIADVSGFEELMRVRIAATVSQAVREVEEARQSRGAQVRRRPAAHRHAREAGRAERR